METNRYAKQCIEKNVYPKSRLKSWRDTDLDEMQTFIGIIMWMGLCNFTVLENYWSNKKIYENYIKRIMSRNRFQLLLKMWHFSNNDLESEDRLQKITPLIDMVRKSFQDAYIPGEYVCIDETLVPFRGRLKFKQYISNKPHKFGIKMLKLCTKGGYTYEFKVY